MKKYDNPGQSSKKRHKNATRTVETMQLDTTLADVDANSLTHCDGSCVGSAPRDVASLRHRSLSQKGVPALARHLRRPNVGSQALRGHAWLLDQNNTPKLHPPDSFGSALCAGLPCPMLGRRQLNTLSLSIWACKVRLRTHPHSLPPRPHPQRSRCRLLRNPFPEPPDPPNKYYIYENDRGFHVAKSHGSSELGLLTGFDTLPRVCPTRSGLQLHCLFFEYIYRD